MNPKVFLVGFGPGDPDLLTIKADRLLREAEIIFYDNLITESQLDAYSGKKVYVGKRKSQHSKTQAEINEILFEACKSYTHIVRLKGGDPLIFGRVGEELLYLQERGIEVEIVPGISAASAAAATCGISLTHRACASSVAYCTGHPAKKIQIPDAQTLVFYMGASTIKTILKKLIEKQWDIETPVAIISNASFPNQQITYTSIKELQIDSSQVISPSIIIVGKVVDFRFVK